MNNQTTNIMELVQLVVHGTVEEYNDAYPKLIAISDEYDRMKDAMRVQAEIVTPPKE